MNRKHEIEKYLMPLLPEEPEEITAKALKREYTNGFIAGQKKAYDECDEVARELSQIKSGCSKWLEEHDAKVRADAIEEYFNELYKASEIAIPVGWLNAKDIVTIQRAREIADRLKEEKHE